MAFFEVDWHGQKHCRKRCYTSFWICLWLWVNICTVTYICVIKNSIDRIVAAIWMRRNICYNLLVKLTVIINSGIVQSVAAFLKCLRTSDWICIWHFSSGKSNFFFSSFIKFFFPYSKEKQNPPRTPQYSIPTIIETETHPKSIIKSWFRQ